MKKSTVTDPPTTATTLILSTGEYYLQPFSAIPERTIPWMWKHYLAFGNLTLLVGDPEQGKSLVALSLAACITTGRNWPNGDTNTVDPGKVLIQTSEDEASYVMRPRFAVAGGNADNLFRLRFTEEGKTFRIERDLGVLAEAKQCHPDLKLIIIDPVFEFTELDQNNNQEARRVLLQLKEWAENNDAAVLGIVHYNKKSDIVGADRVAGAKAITAVPRFVYCVEGSPDSSIRHLMRVKSNLAAPGLQAIDFEIEGIIRSIRGDNGRIQDTEIAHIKWLGYSTTTPQQLQRIRISGTSTNKSVAKQWLTELLVSGEPMAVGEILRRAEIEGHEVRNVREAAAEMQKDRLLRKTGSSREWFWKIPRSFGDITED
jgi:putative DNA primase/helicase